MGRCCMVVERKVIVRWACLVLPLLMGLGDWALAQAPPPIAKQQAKDLKDRRTRDKAKADADEPNQDVDRPEADEDKPEADREKPGPNAKPGTPTGRDRTAAPPPKVKTTPRVAEPKAAPTAEAAVTEAAPKPAATQGQAPQPAGEAEAEPVAGTLEDGFSNYLHFALIGQFDLADKYVQAMLKDPDLAPLSPAGAAKLLELTDKYKDSIDILLLIINNTSIADNARQLLDRIREAHLGQRKDPARINDSIKLLAGTPTQQVTGMQRLKDSGEYAVPWLLIALTAPEQKELRPFVMRAIPELGKKAVNPLLAALRVEDAVLQRLVIEILGKIGYPQSLPYLKQMASDPKVNEAVRQAATAAIGQVVVDDPAITQRSAAELFGDLAEQYYGDIESLRPDPREDRANIWDVSKGVLGATEVPRAIFSLVMCMRCCEASLKLDKSQSAMVALWLAADFRREARLGLDVQTEEVAETLDLTRPRDFLRSVYFARSAGPVHCQMVLNRAIKDRDRDVALGAIAALNRTAGASTIVDLKGETGLSLASALRFPDLLVRLKAALALAQAAPQEPFKGADEVVPILASALQLTGQKFFLLVDPNAESRKNLAEGLQRAQADVIAADRFGTATTAAHKERTHLDGIFLASNMAEPSVLEAIRELAKDPRFSLVPVVLYVKENDNLIADQVTAADPRVGRVLVVAGNGAPEPEFADQLLKKEKEVAAKYGYHELDEASSVALALDAASALRRIAEGGESVFDARAAQAALITALSHPAEELRIAAAQVLARLGSKAAQEALAVVALADAQTPTLRKVTFAALADSARRFGSHLDETLTKKLIEQAFAGPDLELRTAASATLGAVSLPVERAAEIITSTSH